MAASSLASVDLPEPEFPTTDTRRTIAKPNTRVHYDDTHYSHRLVRMMPIMGSMSDDDKEPRLTGVAGIIWMLERAQDLLSLIVGVLLVILAVVVLLLGVVDFFHDARHGSVENAVVNLLNRVLLVLILVEIMHTVVLSLRAHHLVTQPLLAVGLVAVIRKILFVLSSEATASTPELALLIAMIAVFVAALILVSRYNRDEP